MKIVQHNYTDENNSQTTSSPNRKIEFIVIHYTAGLSSAPGSAIATIDSLYIGQTREVSSDFVVDSGAIVQYNPDIPNRYTWHCGGGYSGPNQAIYQGICTNENSIGIETCSDNNNKSIPVNQQVPNYGYYFTDQVVNNLRDLVSYLMSEYNIDINHVIRHLDVTGKTCPGIPGWNLADGSNSEDKWLSFKASLGNGDSSGGSVPASAKGYYYHPLGDYAELYMNGGGAPNQRPHTYDDNGTKTHGWSKLDWGVGADHPVYSMTDGTIYNISGYTGAGGKGYYVYIRTDRKDGTGQTICIRYIELGGLSEITGPPVGVAAGPNSFSGGCDSGSISIPVKMGDLIGYTNNWYNDYSNLHTDFLYEGMSDSNYYEGPTSVPHVTDSTTLNSAFTLKDVGANKAVYCNGDLIGYENGAVPLQGSPSSIYTVYPVISYMVCLQNPIKIAGSSSAVDASGGVSMANKSEVAYVENMDSQAVDFYLTGSMGENWIGQYPNNIQDVNNNSSGLRYAVAICKRELNFDIFSGTAYAKLLRAKMIGETWQSGNNMKEWFENLNESQFAGKSTWLSMTFSDDDLKYAQLVYMNLRYPKLYGSELFSGSQEFYNAIVRGCQQIPIYNLSPISYHPLAFVVNFNTKTNRDEGDQGGAGNFLMYRQRSGDMSGFNNKVQR